MAALPSTKCGNVSNTDNVVRVMLWCVPRVTSTCFLKCMTYVPNSQVWYEPFLYGDWYSTYGRHRESVIRYYRDSRKMGDGGEFTNGTSEISGGYLAGDKPFSWITEQLESSPPGIKCIFSKDMSWGADEHYDYIPKGFRHSFLIRHPYKVFDSWRKAVNRGVPDESKKLNITDLPEFLNPKGHFFKEQYDLYKHVKEHYEPNPVIIDTDDLLADPGCVLKAYCEALGIPYTDDLLKWKPGQQCMDQLWMVSKEQILRQNTLYPHTVTFASTCFGKPKECPQRSELSEDVLCYSDRSMKYYEEMYANRLKVKYSLINRN